MASFGNVLTGQWLIRMVSEIHQQMKHTEAIQQEDCMDYLTPKMKALQSFKSHQLLPQRQGITPHMTWNFSIRLDWHVVNMKEALFYFTHIWDTKCILPKNKIPYIQYFYSSLHTGFFFKFLFFLE